MATRDLSTISYGDVNFNRVRIYEPGVYVDEQTTDEPLYDLDRYDISPKPRFEINELKKSGHSGQEFVYGFEYLFEMAINRLTLAEYDYIKLRANDFFDIVIDSGGGVNEIDKEIIVFRNQYLHPNLNVGNFGYEGAFQVRQIRDLNDSIIDASKAYFKIKDDHQNWQTLEVPILSAVDHVKRIINTSENVNNKTFQNVRGNKKRVDLKLPPGSTNLEDGSLLWKILDASEVKLYVPYSFYDGTMSNPQFLDAVCTSESLKLDLLNSLIHGKTVELSFTAVEKKVLEAITIDEIIVIQSVVDTPDPLHPNGSLDVTLDLSGIAEGKNIACEILNYDDLKDANISIDAKILVFPGGSISEKSFNYAFLPWWIDGGYSVKIRCYDIAKNSTIRPVSESVDIITSPDALIFVNNNGDSFVNNAGDKFINYG